MAYLNRKLMICIQFINNSGSKLGKYWQKVKCCWCKERMLTVNLKEVIIKVKKELGNS